MLLKVENIQKSYLNPAGTRQRTVLNGVSFSLDRGETASVLGPSGSGKSTLLSIIGTLEKPDAGSIVFDGKGLTGLPEKKLDHFRNREIGFVFQKHHLMPQCTLLENVLLPILPVRDKNYRKEAEDRAVELIRAVDLWDQRNQFPWSLSGGECQRAAVVRALINQPRLLLADEPTGSLDHENAELVADLLLKLNAELNCALLVVTHATALAEKMQVGYVLKDGVLNQSS